jgi:hypothetical protein
VILWKLIPLGKYCRNRPLPFSFVPRCHGERGVQKYVHMPVADSSSLNRAISEPLSSQRLPQGRWNRTQAGNKRLLEGSVSCSLPWPTPENGFCARYNSPMPPCLWRRRQDRPPNPQTGICRQQTRENPRDARPLRGAKGEDSCAGPEAGSDCHTSGSTRPADAHFGAARTVLLLFLTGNIFLCIQRKSPYR